MSPLDAGDAFADELPQTATTDQQRARTAAALLREREGYVVRGADDRVEAVDAELARLGYDPKDVVENGLGFDEGVERAVTAPPARETRGRGRGRGAPKQG